MPLELIQRLERHRDFHFRRTRDRRVKSESEALKFISEVGFCTAFTAGLEVPCLREAIVGEREPPLPHRIQHDHAIGMTWRLKDVLTARGAVYYGKAIAGRPAFIAPRMLPAFLRLRVDRASYLTAFRRGNLSLCAKQIMDALRRRRLATTRQLKFTSGCERPSRRAEFDRAIKELQQKFLILKIEERYEPFTYVWSTMDYRWSDAMAQARSLRPLQAAYDVIKNYFLIAGYGNQRKIASVLGIEPELTRKAITRLIREGLVTDGSTRDLYALSEKHLHA